MDTIYNTFEVPSHKIEITIQRLGKRKWNPAERLEVEPSLEKYRLRKVHI